MVTVHIEKDTCVWWSCHSPVKHALFEHNSGMVSPVLELFRVELPSMCLCHWGFIVTSLTWCLFPAYFCLPLVGWLLSHVRLLLPHGLQPTRLLCPWDSPGKYTKVGCHSFLQGIFLSRNPTWVSHTAGRFFTVWSTRYMVLIIILKINTVITTLNKRGRD